jgi:uncharacterized protein (DUF983 family)
MTDLERWQIQHLHYCWDCRQPRIMRHYGEDKMQCPACGHDWYIEQLDHRGDAERRVKISSGELAFSDCWLF